MLIFDSEWQFAISSWALRRLQLLFETINEMERERIKTKVALRELKWAAVILILLMVFPCPVVSQTAFTGASMVGLAGGNPAVVRGNDAIHFNPANLSLYDDGTTVMLSIGDLSASGGGDLIQFEHYSNYLTGGRHLSDADIVAMLDAWFGSSADRELRELGLFAEVVPMAVSVKWNDWAVGAAMRGRIYSRLGVGRGWFDLMMRGTSEPRSIPLDGAFETMVASEISVAISRRFGRLHVGIAPKLLLGMTYSDGVLTSTAIVEEDQIAHYFDYTVRAAGTIKRDVVDSFSLFNSDPFETAETPTFSSYAGMGMGVDLGATYRLRPYLLVAVSLTDIGAISWTGDTETITPARNSFVFEGFEFDRDRIDTEFGGELDDYARNFLDSLATDQYRETVHDESGFSTSLPAALHLGAAYRLGRATFSLGASIPLNDALGNLSGTASSAVGVELQFGPLRLRTGARVGGNGALTLGGGIGLRTRVYEFGLGVSATPRTDMLGSGGRAAVALSLINIKL